MEESCSSFSHKIQKYSIGRNSQSKMMSLTRCFLFAAAMSAVLSMLGCVAAESSPSQPQILISEGTFVRGMMAADQQFGLYMALSETSSPPRASTARTAFQPYPRGGGTGGGDESRGGPVMHVHRAVDQARDAAVNFAGVVRRRAFSPQPSRRRD